MKQPPVLSVLVFTEDTGEQVEPALRALLKKMFQLLDGSCGTHRIEFLPGDQEARRALRGKAHGGGSADSHRMRLQLAGKIADQLAKTDPEGFVAYHSDGDRRWSERSEGDFPDFRRLLAVVIDRLRAPRRQPVAIDPRRIDRLLLLAPYWELEAWLYQNLEVARALCQQLDERRHLTLFDAWEGSRATLDDVKDTKEACCLHDRHNRVLAETAYPKDEAYAAGASFAATVDRMRTCAALLDALARTSSTKE